MADLLSAGVTPAFIMGNDIGQINGYKLCQMVCAQIGDKYVDMVQPVRNLWRIYINNSQKKLDLVNQGMVVDGKSVKVHASNPYATGSIHHIFQDMKNKPAQMVRILIKDLLGSVSSSEIKHMLTDIFGLTLSSEIKWGFYRDPHNYLTTKKNGDRFCFVHPDELKVPLPREAKCGIFSCRIFHKGQFPEDNECYKCFSTEHKGRDCKNEPCCRVCKEPGHTPGDEKCEYYMDNTDVLAFGGDKDPFSNHYMVDFTYNQLDVKSSEHAFLYHKARINGQMDIALEILAARDAKEAKRISKRIRCCHDWDRQKIARNLMKDINISKVESCKEAKDLLHEAYLDKKTIVEAVPNRKGHFWGSALKKEETLHTRMDKWLGDNEMGKIWMEIAEDIWSEPEWTDENDSHGEMEPPAPSPFAVPADMAAENQLLKELSNAEIAQEDAQEGQEDGEIIDSDFSLKTLGQKDNSKLVTRGNDAVNATIDSISKKLKMMRDRSASCTRSTARARIPKHRNGKPKSRSPRTSSVKRSSNTPTSPASPSSAKQPNKIVRKESPKKFENGVQKPS